MKVAPPPSRRERVADRQRRGAFLSMIVPTPWPSRTLTPADARRAGEVDLERLVLLGESRRRGRRRRSSSTSRPARRSARRFRPCSQLPAVAVPSAVAQLTLTSRAAHRESVTVNVMRARLVRGGVADRELRVVVVVRDRAGRRPDDRPGRRFSSSSLNDSLSSSSMSPLTLIVISAPSRRRRRTSSKEERRAADLGEVRGRRRIRHGPVVEGRPRSAEPASVASKTRSVSPELPSATAGLFTRRRRRRVVVGDRDLAPVVRLRRRRCPGR